MQKNSIVKQGFLFLTTGIISTLLDWAMFAALTQVSVGYIISLIVSYTTGAIVNFHYNRKVTFKVMNRTWRRVIVFFSLALISLALSIGLLSFLIEIAYLNPLIARVITTGVIFIVNFFMHKFITFRKRI